MSSFKKSKKKSQWEHREHNIYLPNFAFKELSINRYASRHRIVFSNNEYSLIKTDDEPPVNFERDDWTVYGWLLQHTAYKNYSILSHYNIGKALNFSCRNSDTHKDCNKASKAVKRLSNAGYVLDIRSTYEGRIYPLVRIENGDAFTQAEGFSYWVSEEDQAKAYVRQSKARKRLNSQCPKGYND